MFYRPMKSIWELIPRPIISVAGLINVFLRKHRHSQRAGGMPIGADGKHIPWLTYPAIEFLDGLDFTGKSIFEFGGGGSTLFWARRARDVTTVELDPSWAEHLQRIAPPNVSVLHETNGHSYAETPKTLARNFDVIVVDGAERYRSTQAALHQ